MPRITRNKVVAYITQGDKLLVFSQPLSPEAGIQVPAGTIEEGESPDDAVLREAQEETGLSGIAMRSFLGTRDYDMSHFGLEGVHRRYFYHLTFSGQTPATWRHYESDPSDGSEGPIPFELFWVKWPDGVPELIAGQGDLLPALEGSMLEWKNES
jgi:8-oxo-dGTP diphosphatase